MNRLHLTGVQILLGVLVVLIGLLIGGQIYRTTQLQVEVARVADVPTVKSIDTAADLKTADQTLDQLEFAEIEAEAANLDADITLQ